MSERESVGMRLVAAAASAAAFVVALGACEPGPVWMPGDEPLAMYVPDDRAWEAMAVGCEAWAMTGLTCRRASYREDVAVRVRIGATDRPWVAVGQTEWRPETARDMSVRWGFFVTLTPELKPHVAPHEIGHLLGIWDHLKEPGTLMSADSISGPVPTTADLDALAAIWGVAPWEVDNP